MVTRSPLSDLAAKQVEKIYIPPVLLSETNPRGACEVPAMLNISISVNSVEKLVNFLEKSKDFIQSTADNQFVNDALVFLKAELAGWSKINEIKNDHRHMFLDHKMPAWHRMRRSPVNWNYGFDWHQAFGMLQDPLFGAMGGIDVVAEAAAFFPNQIYNGFAAIRAYAAKEPTVPSKDRSILAQYDWYLAGIDNSMVYAFDKYVPGWASKESFTPQEAYHMFCIYMTGNLP
jgi:hypothetical protein